MSRRGAGGAAILTVMLACGVGGCGTGSGSGATVSASTSATVSASTSAASAAGASAARSTGTRSVVLEPVRRSGRPSSGWTGEPIAAHHAITCTPAQPSLAAVSGSVLSCGSSANLSDTCWASTVRTAVWCLPDPWSHRLSQFSVSSGSVPTVTPVEHPMPLGLELADGLRCRLRDGGSWGVPAQHPDWLGYYYCPVNSTFAYVYGPATAPIDQSSPRWTVQVDAGTERLSTVAVVRAYYVATAP